jgi:hypothetical protein
MGGEPGVRFLMIDMRRVEKRDEHVGIQQRDHAASDSSIIR